MHGWWTGSEVSAGNWQPWDGKRSFKGDKPLRAKFRNGTESKQVLPAERWRGKWGKPFPDDWDYDIVAVRQEGE